VEEGPLDTSVLFDRIENGDLGWIRVSRPPAATVHMYSAHAWTDPSPASEWVVPLQAFQGMFEPNLWESTVGTLDTEAWSVRSTDM
jgi:hypothetical protein